MVFRDAEILQSDLTLFQQFATPRTPAGLRWLLELYAGEFLSDLDATSEDARQWVDTQRTVLRDRFVAMALQGLRDVGGPVADLTLQRLEQEAPYDDAVPQEAMLVAAANGAHAVRAVF